MSMTLILSHNKVLTAKLLRQGYRYHKLRKAFSKFYRRHFDLVSKYDVGLKHFFCKVLLNLNFMATWLSQFLRVFLPTLGVSIQKK